MDQNLPLITFSLGVSASVLRHQGLDELGGHNGQNCFQLQAKGSANGITGRLADGQPRIGGGYRSAPFYVDGASVMKDSNSHGCIVTSETGPFQCDHGVPGENLQWISWVSRAN